MENEAVLLINCGLACLLNDPGGVLDAYGKININCGTFIVSPELNAKLNAKKMSLNAGNIRIKEVKGKIVELDSGTVIDGKTNFKDLFIITVGDLVLKSGGLRSLAEAEGVIVTGTLFYPESDDLSALIKINGHKRAYPGDAYALLGDWDLEKAVAAAPKDSRHIWVSGKITALNRKSLEDAKAGNLKISCSALFSYEGLNAAFGDLFNCPDRILVPDGYEISGNLESGKIPLYGPKIYVKGDFIMEEKDLPLLEKIESIIVKGKAKLPVSTLGVFKEKGKAEDYYVFEGRLHEINGYARYSRGQLAAMSSAGEKISVVVNGRLDFDEDISAEDAACIASLSYNGTVMVPAGVKAALASRVKEANGFMGDPADYEKLSGGGIRDFAGASPDNGDKGSKSINTGTYMLI
jgi:hypothetical protein